MPYKSSYRRKRFRPKRNRRYRRKGRGKVRNVVPSGAAPVARKHIVKLKYAETLEFNIAAGFANTQTYRMNSIFDPNFTGTGHQPYGRDQLVTLFNRYRVFKFSWHISVAPSNDRLHVCVVPVNNLVSSLGPFDNASEFPLAVTKSLGFSGGNSVNFKGSVFLPKLAGVTSVQYKTSDRFSSLMSTNPLEDMQLGLLIFNPTGEGVATSASITLVYHTECYDPLVLGQS